MCFLFLRLILFQLHMHIYWIISLQQTLLYVLITSYPLFIIGIACNFWSGELTSWHPLLPCAIHVGRTLRAFSLLASQQLAQSGCSLALLHEQVNESIFARTKWVTSCLESFEVFWGPVFLPLNISLVRSHKDLSHIKLWDHLSNLAAHISHQAPGAQPISLSSIFFCFQMETGNPIEFLLWLISEGRSQHTPTPQFQFWKTSENRTGVLYISKVL